VTTASYAGSDHTHYPSATPPAIPAIDVAPVRRVALIAAVAGLASFVVLAAVNFSVAHEAATKDVMLTYLVGFAFWTSLPFGATALMMIGILASASWGIVLRRIFQAAARTMWVVALFAVPVVATAFIAGGKYSPFWWADESWFSVPAADRDLDQYKRLSEQFKRAGFPPELAEPAAAKNTRPEAIEEAHHKIHDYLNPPFYAVRTAVYFGILGLIAFLVLGWTRSLEDQDSLTAWGKLRAFSGPGVIVWALLMTFAVTDWVMSLEPTWASSMFPVVFGMNQFMTTMALSMLVFYAINPERGEVLAIVKDKFRIDMGTLLFGFTMVWAYATFCQYMLIWAGNLPEEISYYRKRGDHGWELLAYFLMTFHWLAPFVILLFREVKTNPAYIRAVCLMLLAAGLGDLIWWIVPSLPHPDGGLHVPMAIAAVVGLGGVWGLVFARELAKRPVLPANREGAFLANWGHH
jgi:hypothetical protein